MDVQKFETTMLEYLLETLRKEKSLSYDDIAKKVYGTENVQQSRLKLYRLRKPSTKNGSIKKLTLVDFVLICEALRESPAEVLAQVSGKVRRGEP